MKKKPSKKCTFKFQEYLIDLSVKNYWQISSDKKTFFSDFLVKYMSTYSYILRTHLVLVNNLLGQNIYQTGNQVWAEVRQTHLGVKVAKSWGEIQRLKVYLPVGRCAGNYLTV